MRCLPTKQKNQTLSFVFYVQFLCALSLMTLLSTSACVVPVEGDLGSSQGALDYSQDAVSSSDIFLEEEQLEEALVFDYKNDPYCSEVAGTPTLGICKDNGCKKRGGKCKAVDSDSDGIRDNCVCKGAKKGSSVDSVSPVDRSPATPRNLDDGAEDEDDIGPLPGPKPAVSSAGGGCTVTAGTIHGICADSGCKKRGGKCKAVDTDDDGIRDDCKCKGAKRGTSQEAVFNY